MSAISLKDSVHIWWASITQLADRLDDFASMLSPDEHERAARFLHNGVRQRFVIAHGMLRTVLSQYTMAPPQDITFAHGPRGKPFLSGSAVTFNLAHSEDVVLIGVTEGREIGVDVEHIHAVPEMAIVAFDYFSPLEFTTLFLLPENQRETGFFTCWTRKEAYLKATGHGFKHPLTSFDVTLTPGEPALLTRTDGDDPTRWTLVHLEPRPGYLAAVCVEGPAGRLVYKELTP